MKMNGICRPRYRVSRRRLRALGAALVVALELAACGTSGTDGKGDGYVFESVERGRVVSSVTATGTINPVNSVQVGTYVSGPIRAIDVDYNSIVKRGQRVAKIDPAPFLVKVKKAEASLANAAAKVQKDRADLAMKKLTRDRSRELWEANLIARNEADQAGSEYDQGVAQLNVDLAGVEQARADLDEARINLAYTDITSPVDGVVVARNVNVGQTVAATFQTPTLFVIAEDLTQMQVDTSVSESDIGTVQAELAAHFVVDAYPGREFQGKVVQVRNAPTTVQNVVTYDVVVGVANPDLQLKPGMTANVTIVTSAKDDTLRVSTRALRFNPETTPTAVDGKRDSTTAIWVQQADATLKRVPVTVGIRNDEFAEIIDGEVTPGAQVAVALKRIAKPAPQAQSIPGAPRYR